MRLNVITICLWTDRMWTSGQWLWSRLHAARYAWKIRSSRLWKVLRAQVLSWKCRMGTSDGFSALNAMEFGTIKETVYIWNLRVTSAGGLCSQSKWLHRLFIFFDSLFGQSQGFFFIILAQLDFLIFIWMNWMNPIFLDMNFNDKYLMICRYLA